MRRFLSLFLVLLLALHGFVPDGFMLVQAEGGDGKLTLVICSGDGADHSGVGPDGKTAPAKSKASHVSLCPYAASGAVSINDHAPDIIPSQLIFLSVVYEASHQNFSAALKSRAHPARGPPSVSV